MRALPDYVSDKGHGQICYETPLKINDVTSYHFILGTDRDQLQKFVDDQLNVVSGGAVRYTALPFLFHSYLEALHCTSTAEPIGYLWDRESAFLVPVLQHRTGHLLPELRIWVPYLLIDSPAGMVTGREVWGYRKSFGQMTLPGRPEDSQRLAAETIIFRKFSPETRGESATLLEVTRKTRLGDGGSWSGFDQVIAEVLKKIGGEFGALIESQFMALLSNLASPVVVNLKQIRDARNSAKACYQAHVESPCHLDRFTSAGWLQGDYELKITTCDSHRIVTDLGLGSLGPGGSTTVPVRFAYWVKMDFSTLAGNVIWEAP